MICLSKVAKITDRPAAPSVDYVFINTLNWYPNNVQVINTVKINSYEVTPYYIKDEEGHIFENVYQHSKCYRKVYAQHQVYNNIVTWSHPEEIHLDANNNVLPAYWHWRHKGMSNLYPVRYPNGFKGRHECLCAFWQNSQGSWEQLNYLEGRKKIYCSLYRRLVQKTSAFSELKKLHDAGVNLQFIDVDVPPGNTFVTQEVYDKYLNDTAHAFGHSFVLSGLLLDLDLHL